MIRSMIIYKINKQNMIQKRNIYTHAIFIEIIVIKSNKTNIDNEKNKQQDN